MGHVKEAYERLLDALTAEGAQARQQGAAEPSDAELIDLARDAASDLGADGLLPDGDLGDIVTDLRDAYDEGRAPELLDFEQVVTALTERGVAAHVEHTSGGDATVYAGPWMPEDEHGGERRAIALGPGSFFGPNHTQPAGYSYQLTYGLTTGTGGGHEIDDHALPKQVADAIADLVTEISDPRLPELPPRSYLMDQSVAWFIADNQVGVPTLYLCNYYDMGGVAWSEHIPAEVVGDWTNTRWQDVDVTPELISEWFDRLTDIGLVNNSRM